MCVLHANTTANVDISLKAGWAFIPMRRQKFPKSITVIGLSFVIAGSAYLIVPAIRTKKLQAEGRVSNQERLEKAQKHVQKPLPLRLGTPVSLSLPRLSIDKEVLPGFYNQALRTWTLDETHAFFMKQASMPIIYGHDTAPVFKALDGVAKNEILKIKNSDGDLFFFKYIGDENILPTSSDVISTFKPNTVLLITCSGIHYQTRRVLTFEYLGQDQVSSFQKPEKNI